MKPNKLVSENSAKGFVFKTSNQFLERFCLIFSFSKNYSNGGWMCFQFSLLTPVIVYVLWGIEYIFVRNASIMDGKF